MAIENMSKSKVTLKTRIEDAGPVSPFLSVDFIKDLRQSGGVVFEVGGSVRDYFLGRHIKDYDLVICRLPLHEIKKILARHGIVSLVGKSFGIIKFKSTKFDCQLDIALPRKERSTGSGHRDFDVDFDPHIPIEEDLKRRDFTINAMALEIGSSRFIDPYQGKNDIDHKLIRSIQKGSFEEDPLRLLRAIQFATRFNFKIEEKTWEEIISNNKLIRTVSSERISEEINKLLSSDKPSQGFHLMHESGLLQEIFPELEATINVEQGNKIQNDDVFKHTMRVLDAARKDNAIENSGNLDLLLAALYHDVGKSKTKRFFPQEDKITFYGHQLVSKRMLIKRFNTLKLSHIGANIEDVSCLIEHHMFQTKSFFSDKAIRRFINKIGKDLIFKLIDLRIADNRGGKYPDGIKGIQKLKKRIIQEIEKESPFGIKDLAINGHDIMDLGIQEGPDVGRILHQLLEIVLDDPTKNTREALLNIIKSGKS